MKNKMLMAVSVAAVAVVVIAAIVVVNPFASSPTAGGEESMHSEGMAALGTNGGGEEAMHSEGMAALGTDGGGGEESMHSDGMAPLTVNVEAETRIRTPDGDGGGAVAKPYIGVAVSETESGAARVVEVLEEGPSKGVLEAGDLITAVEGEAIEGARGLADAVAKAGAGAALSLTVTRDDRTSDVSVSVGEMSEDAASQVRRYSYSRTFDLPQDGFPMKPGADFDMDVFEKLAEMDEFDFPMKADMDMLEKFAEMDEFDFSTKMDMDMLEKFAEMDEFDMSMKADMDMLEKFADMDAFGFTVNLWGEGGVAGMEKTVEVEDGEFETHRAIMGTVTDVDADAGTFTLQPIDSSAAITYSITDDTKTFISASGNLGGLAADGETPTFVMDVDGVAEMVGQGWE